MRFAKLFAVLPLLSAIGGCDFFSKKDSYHTYCDESGCYHCDERGCTQDGKVFGCNATPPSGPARSIG